MGKIDRSGLILQNKNSCIIPPFHTAFPIPTHFKSGTPFRHRLSQWKVSHLPGLNFLLALAYVFHKPRTKMHEDDPVSIGTE